MATGRLCAMVTSSLRIVGVGGVVGIRPLPCYMCLRPEFRCRRTVHAVDHLTGRSAVLISLSLRSSPSDPRVGRACGSVAQVGSESWEDPRITPAYAFFSFPTLPLISNVPDAATPETLQTT